MLCINSVCVLLHWHGPCMKSFLYTLSPLIFKVSLNSFLEDSEYWVSQRSALLWPEGRGVCPLHTLDHTLRCLPCAFVDLELVHKWVPPTIHSAVGLICTLFLQMERSTVSAWAYLNYSAMHHVCWSWSHYVIIKCPKIATKKTCEVKKISLICRCIFMLYSWHVLTAIW